MRKVIFICFILSLLFSGCEKEEDITTSNRELLSKIDYEEGFNFSIEFDIKGNPTLFNNDEITAVYTVDCWSDPKQLSGHYLITTESGDGYYGRWSNKPFNEDLKPGEHRFKKGNMYFSTMPNSVSGGFDCHDIWGLS